MSARNYLIDAAHQIAENIFNRKARHTGATRPGRAATLESLESRVLLSVPPLTGTTGNTITGSEGSSTGTVLLGEFTDGNTSDTTSSFTLSGGSTVVNWGDGSAPQVLIGSNLTYIGVAGAGEWTVNAAHTYTEEGTYAYTVSVTDSDGAATITSGSAVIADAVLLPGLPTNLTPNPGVALPNTTVVAVLSDSSDFATTSDFTTTIDWGDGSPQSTGVVVATVGPGVFDIEAPHTYTTPGSYTTLVTVHDDGGAQLVISGSANVNPYATTISNVSNSTITIHTASHTFAGKITAGSLIPTGDVSVTLNGVTQTAAIKKNGTFSTTFNTSTLPVGPYSVSYNYAGDSEFEGYIATTTLDVTYGIKPNFKNVKYKPGSTIDIDVLLIDAAGKLVSTTGTGVTTGLAKSSSPGTLLPGVDVGLALTLDSDGDAFSLKLKTTGLAAGAYILYFTISGDPVTHSVTFTIA